MVEADTHVFALRGVVSGQVQGVGFRAFVKREALNRGLRGQACNLNDGRVEVILLGEYKMVAELQSVIVQGPPAARVTNVSWEPYVNEEFEGFEIG